MNSHITGRIKPEMRLADEMIQRLLVCFGQAIDTLTMLLTTLTNYTTDVITLLEASLLLYHGLVLSSSIK